MHGNTGEPNASARDTVNTDIPYQKCPIPGGKYRLHHGSKEKSGIVSGIKTEGNRRQEKGEGSLSILIVLQELRGIRPGKPGLGKGDA